MTAVFFLALSVAVDACAAAMCCGLETPGFRFRDGLRAGLLVRGLSDRHVPDRRVWQGAS